MTAPPSVAWEVWWNVDRWAKWRRAEPRGALARSARSSHLASVLYLVIESFRDGDPRPVYERFGAQGRLAPPELRYVGSWVTTDLRRCYQVMECDDPAHLESWMARWRDLVEFEVLPVLSSPDAAAAVAAMRGGTRGDA